jgi:hypothetical protein
MLLFGPLWFWSAAIALVYRHWPLSVADSAHINPKKTLLT